MPDMTTIVARWCLTNEFYEQEVPSDSDPDKSYMVRFNRGAWSCNCPSYKWRGTACKHIHRAEKDRCGYGWEAAAGSPLEFPDKTCPECGGPTTVVEVAV